MTVPATARRAGPYNGNGSTTSFSFSFKTFAAGDLLVTRKNASGVETVLVLNSDYSVTLNGDQDASPGGSITYPISGSPLATGQTITIVGDLEYEQTTDLLGGGAFNARVIEDTFDRSTIQIQQLEERLDRAIVAAVSDTAVDMTLPTAANRANRYLSFDVTGKPVSTTFDVDAVQNASTAAVAAAAAAAASETNAAASEAVALAQASFVTSTVAATTPTVVNFSGNGSTVAFTLPSAPGAEENTLVFIGGVYQQKTEYSVSGTTLTFTSAPPAGTNNIEVQIGPATNIALNTSLGVSFLQAGTGAVTRTAQSKMRDVVNVNDYGGDLAYAVTSLGATAARLVVSSPVSISSDLTIPSNISVRVEGAGIITVASGKRLYINGPFSCDRLHRAFNAPLISVSITADINANALNISAVSANLVEAGQVVTGTGVAGGTMIAADYGVTGVGQVALNMYNGVLTSRAMTLTGASVIFGKGTVDQVYPQWWGAVADGVTDSSAAIAHAIYSIRWGGKVKIPAGKYRVTSGAVLHGSLIVEGDGAGDTNTGAPPTAETQAPTYIFLDADNTNIFTIPPKADHVIVRDMSLGTALTTSVSPVGTGRKGIVFNGHAPQFLFMPKIENCYFFQFQMGVLINDDWAEVGDGYAPTGYYWTNQIVNATAIVQGNAYQIATVGTTNWAAITGTVLSGTLGTVGCRFLPNATAPTGNGTAYLMPTYFDWGVNPGLIQDCEFRSNSYGVYFNTTNADAWRIVGCDFLMPANSSGVYLRRCGYLRMEACFGYAGGAASSEFVNAVGAGVTALDTVTLDSCQAEYCSHFLNYSAASTTTISVIFNVLNCKHELNADVYLGRMCQYNSYNTQILSYIYVQASGVRVSSINDWYQFVNYSSGPTWHISVVSGDANTIHTYIPGRYPSSTLTGPIINGIPLFGGAAAGSPVGVVTPVVTGQEYLDNVAGKWYKSTGLSSADWVALN